MGTDIHLIVQVCKNGLWEALDGQDYEGNPSRSYHDDGKPEKTWDIWRNYSLFAILADVRNGYGFAGCDTGDGFVPISKPRGLPSDLGVIQDVYTDDNTYFGDHSHSWLGLNELLAYNWDQVTICRGWVNRQEFDIFEKNGVPESWCGGIGGAIKAISNDEMRALPPDYEGPPHLYTQISWKRAYRQEVESFLGLVEKWKNLGDPSDVRIVFGFDS